jgi:hypothetical protein
MEIRVDYFIYDERYYTDPDGAIVYEVCETLAEAKENGPEYGGHVIVKAQSRKEGSNTYTVIDQKIIQ